MSIDVGHLFSFFGLILFGLWLLRTSMGKRALEQAPIRRTNMHPAFMLAVLLIWQVPPVVLLGLVNPFLAAEPVWIHKLAQHIIMSIGALLAVICFCVLAWFTFSQRLKGLGLRLCRVHKDFARAALILLCLQPLVLSMIVVTDHIGRWVQGGEYQQELHEGLRTLQQHAPPILAITVVVMAVLIAPLVEEMLFRGLLQTLFRSYLGRPWPSIILCSCLFVTVHINVTHWPALFVLSMGMGYAYEQSGSLWQPIFIHALFNGTAVLPYLLPGS